MSNFPSDVNRTERSNIVTGAGSVLPTVNPGIFVDNYLTTSVINDSNGTFLNQTNDSFIDDYEYDFESSPPLEELIPVSLAYSLTLTVGICGNFLVIFAVLKYKRLRSITNAFLTSLASADLLLVLICVPVKGIGFMSFTWTFGPFLCKFVHYMQTVSMICSVMTLTVMSIERFIAIAIPLRAKYICTGSHARLVIVITWILSFIMAVPVLIIQTHQEVGHEDIKAYWCVKKYGTSLMAILYESYMFVIIFAVPVWVMIVAYAGICVQLSRMSGARQALGASQGGSGSTDNTRQGRRFVAPIYRHPNRVYKEQRARKNKMDEDTCKVIQMLIVVVVLFIVCWGPILINNLLVATGVLPELHIGYLKPMRQTFFLLSYMNSCTNPVVYGFMSKHFRQSFKHAICCCFRKKKSQYRDRSSQSFATRTTVVTNCRTENGTTGGSSLRPLPKTEYRSMRRGISTNIDAQM